MQFIDQKIENYAISKSNTVSDHCRDLATYTRENEPMAVMLIGEMEASFLGFLIHSLGVKRVLEIGTYTGYSALAMAEQLPSDGVVFTLDIEKKDYTESFWQRSPHGKKIQMLVGPALENIPRIEGEFDLVFIDADKTNYRNYLDMVLPRLSEKGIIAIDNVLWSGKVLEDDKNLQGDDHASTRAIKEINDYIAGHPELYGTMLPVRDGIFLIKKR